MKLISSNKKAFHDYEIIKKYEAGISFFGSEIKSIRNSSPTMTGSFVIFNKGEAFLINLNIPDYKFSPKYLKHDPTRSRRLLLHKREIRKINQQVNEKRLVVIPLKLYWTSNSLIKVEIATARPLKKYDLREKSKEKSIKRNQW